MLATVQSSNRSSKILATKKAFVLCQTMVLRYVCIVCIKWAQKLDLVRYVCIVCINKWAQKLDLVQIR